MVDHKKLSSIVAALAPLLLINVQSGCGRSADLGSEDSPAPRSGPRRPGRQTERTPTSGVDLESLLNDVPEYQGQERNLFAFGREPSPGPPPGPSVATTTAPRGEVAPPVARQTAAPPIDLKFAGFVETSQPGGEMKKYAVFLSGSEILTGAEGDLVANRFEIVQIGLESVTLSVRGSNATQKIPLSVN